MAKKKEGAGRLAVAYVLLGMAVVALGLGLLYALIDTIAVADNELNPGTRVFSTFLYDVVWTLMVSGILYGLYCLAAFAKEKSDLLDGDKGSE
jgi:hypothetical protein